MGITEGRDPLVNSQANGSIFENMVSWNKCVLPSFLSPFSPILAIWSIECDNMGKRRAGDNPTIEIWNSHLCGIFTALFPPWKRTCFNSFHIKVIGGVRNSAGKKEKEHGNIEFCGIPPHAHTFPSFSDTGRNDLQYKAGLLQMVWVFRAKSYRGREKFRSLTYEEKIAGLKKLR